MAEGTLDSTIKDLQSQSILRSIGLLIGIALSVSLGFALVLWAQKPDFRLLYAGLENKDASEIVDILEQENIKYDIQPGSGSILVPSDKVTKIRLKLAGLGIPHSTSQGFELLDKKQGFGSSQFMERVRFKRALEGELSRTISGFNSVSGARVHLAIPKQTIFVNDRRTPTASVFLDLYSGRRLKKNQVNAIVNLVASSVPEMPVEAVTVVDESGNLLSGTNGDDSLSVTSRQLTIKQEIESELRARVLSILTPIYGISSVRAQVSAELDFTVTEETSELYNQEDKNLRSAHEMREGGEFSQKVGGIPGALSNVPPQQAQVESPGDDGDEGANKLQRTLNYELDKTISHTKQQPWILNRLSVAVAIDDNMMQATKNKDGKKASSANNAAADTGNNEKLNKELSKIKALIYDALGLNENRGDRLQVLNIPFMEDQEIEALPEPKFWTQPWFIQIIKYVVVGISLIGLIFGLLKPGLNSLFVGKNTNNNNMLPDDLSSGMPGGGAPALPGTLPAVKTAGIPQLPELSDSYGGRMESVRGMVHDDPGRVAQVIMNWVGDDGGP